MQLETITKKRNGVLLVLDGEEYLIDTEIFGKYAFDVGKIDGHAFFKMKEESDALRCHRYLLDQINRYEKTAKGYLETLLGKGFPYPICQKEIEEAVQKRYIDDRRFCECYLTAGKNKKGWNRLAMELKAKGVDEEILLSFHEEFGDGSEACRKETKKLLKHDDGSYQSRQKIFQKLLRKGFSADEIKRCLAFDPDDGTDAGS